MSMWYDSTCLGSQLAGTLEQIRALTRKNTPFVWSTECENAFATLSESPCLAYCDGTKEVMIQVDSRKHGIGAVLLKAGCPVVYASHCVDTVREKLDTKGKRQLSIQYNLKRFGQYMYGRPMKVENDHKPLAATLRKPLTQAPKCYQDIRMQYHRYDIQFVFVMGTN